MRRPDGAEQGGERPDGATKAVRWLGLLLPLLLTYPLLPFVEFGSAWFQIRVILGAACWVGATAVLLWRRDWRGATAISGVYVLADSWWILPAFGVISLD